MEKTQGKLYLVSTPIGNLKDITIRALEVLKKVDLVIAEDSRRSLKLFEYFDIESKLDTSYYQGVEKKRAGKIVKKLKEGRNIALITDAGTPLISDPGYPLVKLAREEGVEVIPIPGPVALIAGLIASGLPVNSFIFDGTLPKSDKKKRDYFKKMKLEKRTIVLYESPHRITATLEIIQEILGDREIALCRELTKRYEEIIKGTPSEILDHITIKDKVRGEMTLVIQGASVEEINEAKRREYEDVLIKEQVANLISRGMTKREAIKEAAKLRGINKSEAYDQLLKEEGKK